MGGTKWLKWGIRRMSETTPLTAKLRERKLFQLASLVLYRCCRQGVTLSYLSLFPINSCSDRGEFTKPGYRTSLRYRNILKTKLHRKIKTFAVWILRSYWRTHCLPPRSSWLLPRMLPPLILFSILCALITSTAWFPALHELDDVWGPTDWSFREK